MAPHKVAMDEGAAQVGREFGLRLAALEAANPTAPTEEQVRLFFVPQYWRLAHAEGADDRARFEQGFLAGYHAGTQRAGEPDAPGDLEPAYTRHTSRHQSGSRGQAAP